MKNEDSLLSEVLDWTKTIVLALVIALIIKCFLFEATRVEGISMQNTLETNDMLFINKLEKHFKDYERGNIVVLKAPDQKNKRYIKRVIGVGGDKISIDDGKVYVNGDLLKEDYISTDYTELITDQSEWSLSDGEYFVMGDNRFPMASNDSRNFGPISKDRIIGKAVFRFYPFDRIGSIK